VEDVDARTAEVDLEACCAKGWGAFNHGNFVVVGVIERRIGETVGKSQSRYTGAGYEDFGGHVRLFFSFKRI
jgi:hypothetical protein